MQPFSCQHREHHISKQDYEISEVKEIHISRFPKQNDNVLSVEYKMQPFSCQHREHHISKQDYEISEVKEIHISRLEPQRWSLKFFVSFSKVSVRDLAFMI